MQPSFSRPSPWCWSLPGDDSQQAGDDSQQAGHLAAGRNQDGADRSSAPLQISPPQSHTQHPKHEPSTLASRCGEGCPRHARCRYPSRRAGSTRCSRAQHPPARRCPPHGRWAHPGTARHKAHGARHQRIRRGRSQPTALVPGRTPTAAGAAGRGQPGGRQNCSQGNRPRRRGARTEPEPSADGAGKGCLRTSVSRTVNQNPRGAAKGGASSRVPARPRPPERHLPKREAKRSLRLLGPLQVPAPRHRHAAHGSRTARSRTGCLFDLLPRSQGTL